MNTVALSKIRDAVYELFTLARETSQQVPRTRDVNIKKFTKESHSNALTYFRIVLWIRVKSAITSKLVNQSDILLCTEGFSIIYHMNIIAQFEFFIYKFQGWIYYAYVQRGILLRLKLKLSNHSQSEN